MFHADIQFLHLTIAVAELDTLDRAVLRDSLHVQTLAFVTRHKNLIADLGQHTVPALVQLETKLEPEQERVHLEVLAQQPKL